MSADLSSYPLVQDFLFNKIGFDPIALEKTWSSELKVRYSSREVQARLAEHRQVEFRVRSKTIQNLSSKEKLNFYILARLLSISCGKTYSAFFLDFNQLLKKLGFSNNPKYYYLEHLRDSFFLWEIEVYLWNERTNRNFHRQINQISKKYNGKRFLEYFKSVLLETTFVVLPSIRPRKLVRHKGYRDHGALGSEYSRTLREQTQSDEWKKITRAKEKESQDRLELTLALAGWI